MAAQDTGGRVKMNEVQIGNKKVGGSNPCFIVAEIGINFDGKYEQALKLIDAAANAGCDAVKFQLFKAEKMYTENAGKYKIATGEKQDIIPIVKDGELPHTWIPDLKKYANSKNLVFFSSVCDEHSADVLEANNGAAYKMTSYGVTHIPLMKYAARKKKPVIFSCGGATLQETAEALYAIKGEGNNQIVLMHCIAKYPCPLNSVNLNVIKTLQFAFPDIVIGYSDHSSEPIEAPCAAAALGAKMIEKHITLDRKLPGPDHSFALDPTELKQMVSEIRKTEEMMKQGKKINIDPQLLGSSERKTYDIEKSVREFAFRTIFAIKNIKKGDALTKENIAVLRPGEKKRGLEPKYYGLLTEDGGCCATKNIPLGKSIQWDDVLSR